MQQSYRQDCLEGYGGQGYKPLSNFQRIHPLLIQFMKYKQRWTLGHLWRLWQFRCLTPEGNEPISYASSGVERGGASERGVIAGADAISRGSFATKRQIR